MKRLPQVPPDVRVLFATRVLRLLAYGFLSVVLALYLGELDITDAQIGLLFSLTLAGDTVVSLLITTSADRLGRRRMLVLGAGLMAAAGAVFASTRGFWILLLAATIGVISPSGGEVGPFLSIEQASLSHLLPDDKRTAAFAWYNLVGSFAAAAGALLSGVAAAGLQGAGLGAAGSYRVILLAYAAMGLGLAALFLRLSPAVEAAPRARGAGARPFLGLHRSRAIVLRLSALFTVDAFAGGFIVQSLMAYWFYKRFGAEPALLGSIFFVTNIIAGVSALSAAAVARRIGLVNTMAFTHLPSNVLLMLVPLMPSLPLAIAMVVVRSAIGQMDVPTRQSYTMAVVAPDERAAASGITSVARTTGASLAPVFTGLLLASRTLMGAPFLIAGGLKIVYDLLLLRAFRGIRPPEERARRGEPAPETHSSQEESR